MMFAARESDGEVEGLVGRLRAIVAEQKIANHGVLLAVTPVAVDGDV